MFILPIAVCNQQGHNCIPGHLRVNAIFCCYVYFPCCCCMYQGQNCIYRHLRVNTIYYCIYYCNVYFRRFPRRLGVNRSRLATTVIYNCCLLQPHHPYPIPESSPVDPPPSPPFPHVLLLTVASSSVSSISSSSCCSVDK